MAEDGNVAARRLDDSVHPTGLSVVRRLNGMRWLGPLSILVVGLSLSSWSYFLTRFSGYWDDTVFLVALARGLEGNPLQVLESLILAPGDTYGPLLVGGTWVARSTGLMGNGALNAFASMALLGLALVVYALARELRLSRWMSTWTGLVILFTPALVDQRLWFVSVQHTVTITLILVAVLLITRITRLMAEARWERSLLVQIMLLDMAMIGMAFGREVVLAAAVFVTLGLALYARSLRATVLVSVGWLIPLFAVGRALLTGRSGTQVATIGLVGPAIDAMPSVLLQIVDEKFWILFTVAIMVVVLTQSVLLIGRRSPHLDRVSGFTFASDQRALLAITISVALIVGTTLLVPRTVVLQAAALPGMNLVLDYQQTFAGRWAMYVVPVVALLATFILLWLLGLLGRGAIPIFATGAALASVAPYVGSNFVNESIFGGKVPFPVDSLSRYVVYVAPFGTVLVAWVLSEMARRWRKIPINSLALLLLAGAVVVSVTATTYRATNIQSLIIVGDGPNNVRIVQSDRLKKYLVGYGDTLPGQILSDVEAIRDDVGLTRESLGGDVQWSP